MYNNTDTDFSFSGSSGVEVKLVLREFKKCSEQRPNRGVKKTQPITFLVPRFPFFLTIRTPILT